MILSAENYFSVQAQMSYMSYSQFKDFSECEYCAVQKIKGFYKEPQTDAFLLGNYIDAHFECRLDIFKAQNPRYKRIQKKADKIIQRVEQDKMFMKYMDGQKQVIMTGLIGGAPVKIKIDSYLPDKAIVDFKSVKDFKPLYKPGEGKLNFIEYWLYHLQGAVYQEIVRQNIGKRLPFVIAAATKEEVPNLNLFRIPQEVLDTQLLIFTAEAPVFQALKSGEFELQHCGNCIPCKTAKKIDRLISWEELNEYE